MKKYNKQGIRLIDDQLLVLPDEVDDIVQEKDLGGGKKLYMAKAMDSNEAEKLKLMDEAAQTKAVIIDISPDAYLDWDDENKPEIGERILMQKHAGNFYEGADGIKYRLISEAEVDGLINF